MFSGVALNFLIFYQATVGILERRGHYEMVEKVGLYWHFVDLVWVFVFSFFYLVEYYDRARSFNYKTTTS